MCILEINEMQSFSLPEIEGGGGGRSQTVQFTQTTKIFA